MTQLLKRTGEITPPNPGSDEALDAGCKCPLFDNGFGEGWQLSGEKVWWVNDDCPIHAGVKT